MRDKGGFKMWKFCGPHLSMAPQRVQADDARARVRPAAGGAAGAPRPGEGGGGARAAAQVHHRGRRVQGVHRPGKGGSGGECAGTFVSCPSLM